MGVREFFKNAFQDMKESAKAQHEVDKANFAAAKAESKAQWEEAKASPAARKAKIVRSNSFISHIEHMICILLRCTHGIIAHKQKRNLMRSIGMI